MSSRCRFCGGKIVSDAINCDHCGKQLRKPVDSQPEKPRVTNIDSWKGKTIPPWLMYLIVGFFLACFVVMFLDAGTDHKPAQPPETSTQKTQPSDHQAPENEPDMPTR